jgi:hypothetical protein
MKPGFSGGEVIWMPRDVNEDTAMLKDARSSNLWP